MKFDIANGKGIEFTFGSVQTNYGTVTKVFILKSTDGGNTFTKCQELAFTSGSSRSISYEGEVESNVRYALVVIGTKPRLILETVTIKGVEI